MATAEHITPAPSTASLSAQRNVRAAIGGVKIEADPWTLLFFAMLFIGAVMRFVALPDMALHHDESLYARTSFNMFTGGDYRYDPLQHGPFMFHFTAFYFFLFGDSDFTIRFVPATLGVLILLMVWQFRYARDYGLRAASIAVALLAVTPISLYFNRFYRHDTPFAFWNVLVPVGYILYLKTRKSLWLIAFGLGIGGMFSTKENAFVSIIIFLAFGAGYAIVEAFRRSSEAVEEDEDETEALPKFSYLNALGSVLTEHSFLTLWFASVGFWGLWISVFCIQHVADLKWFSTQSPQAVTPTGEWYLGIMCLIHTMLVMGFGIMTYLARQKEEEGADSFAGLPMRFYDQGYSFVASFVAFGVICTLLYTSFFTSGRPSSFGFHSFFDGLGRWFVYWYHQHNIARIKGPFLYYVPHLIIYEPLTLITALFAGALTLAKRWWFAIAVMAYLIFSIIANVVYSNVEAIKGLFDALVLKLPDQLFLFPDLLMLIGLVLLGIWLATEHVLEKRPFRALLATWMILAFVAYSYLQEKVPWLGLHIVIPMHLYAAGALADLTRKKLKQPFKIAVIVVLVPLAAYGIRSAHRLAYLNPDNAIEQAVYVQTNRDIVHMVEEIKDISRELGMGENMPIGVNSDASWPLMWYLRDFKNVSWSSSTPNRPVVITNWENLSNHEAELQDYWGRRLELRSWFIPSTFEWLHVANLPVPKFIRDRLPQTGFINSSWGADWNLMWRYLIKRERWTPQSSKWKTADYGTVDIIFWVHRDIDYIHNWEMATDERRPLWDREQRWTIPATMRERAKERRPAQVARINPRQQQIIGRQGGGAAQFQEPRFVAVSLDGSMMAVTDTGNHRVQVFSASGEHMGSWGSNGAQMGQFNQPYGAAFDDQGRLWVTDTWNHRLQVLDPQTGRVQTVIAQEGMFYAPKGITFDPISKSMWVVNTGQHRVMQFSTETLQETRSFGSLSEQGARGQFYEPVGVAVSPDGKTIYVADTNHHRIQLFDSLGRYQDEWAVDGFDDFFTEPQVATDAAGNVFVSDSSRHRLVVYGPDGILRAYWGGKGNRGGQFQAARGVTVGPDGRVYVADTLNHRVQIFDMPALPDPQAEG